MASLRAGTISSPPPQDKTQEGLNRCLLLFAETRDGFIFVLMQALVSSWKKGDTMLFIFDTVWDLIKLADHLTQREDVDPSRTGIIGESLGGMHAWFGAAADTRYSVAAPIIGVQGFRWAIEHDKWQARVDSILRLYLKLNAMTAIKPLNIVQYPSLSDILIFC
ncbi:UNVERIFIED_CONTAM: hypothetical protein Sindi_1591800 [Sesamum indicum]